MPGAVMEEMAEAVTEAVMGTVTNTVGEMTDSDGSVTEAVTVTEAMTGGTGAVMEEVIEVMTGGGSWVQ